MGTAALAVEENSRPKEQSAHDEQHNYEKKTLLPIYRNTLSLISHVGHLQHQLILLLG